MKKKFNHKNQDKTYINDDGVVIYNEPCFEDKGTELSKKILELDHMNKGILSTSRRGDVTELRRYLESFFWDGLFKIKENIILTEAIIRNDYKIAQVLKHYSSPLDETSLRILKEEAKDSNDLKRFYSTMRKAGIYNILTKAPKGKKAPIKEKKKPTNKSIVDLAILFDQAINNPKRIKEYEENSRFYREAARDIGVEIKQLMKTIESKNSR